MPFLTPLNLEKDSSWLPQEPAKDSPSSPGNIVRITAPARQPIIRYAAKALTLEGVKNLLVFLAIVDNCRLEFKLYEAS
tara:strand:+ start:304 stop:540 length:237 start_codon:yes stop_codon:yes gene_type:complete